MCIFRLNPPSDFGFFHISDAHIKSVDGQQQCCVIPAWIVLPSGRLCSGKNPLSEQVVIRPSIHLTLDRLHAVDVSLDRAGAAWLGEGGTDRGVIAINAVGKGPQLAGAGGFEPRLEAGVVMVADHSREGIRQDGRLDQAGSQQF